MLTLINRVRSLVGDPASEAQAWTEDEIEAALDRNRAEVRYAELRAIETISAGGNVTYTIFEAGQGDFEAPTFVDSGFNVISPTTSDDLTGRYTWAAEPARPVMITGFYYDLYGAAVEILEAWIAKLKGSIDLSVDNLSLKRSQKVENLTALADRYRALSWANAAGTGSGGGRLIQSDFYTVDY